MPSSLPLPLPLMPLPLLLLLNTLTGAATALHYAPVTPLNASMANVPHTGPKLLRASGLEQEAAVQQSSLFGIPKVKIPMPPIPALPIAGDASGTVDCGQLPGPIKSRIPACQAGNEISCGKVPIIVRPITPGCNGKPQSGGDGGGGGGDDGGGGGGGEQQEKETECERDCPFPEPSGFFTPKPFASIGRSWKLSFNAPDDYYPNFGDASLTITPMGTTAKDAEIDPHDPRQLTFSREFLYPGDHTLDVPSLPEATGELGVADVQPPVPLQEGGLYSVLLRWGKYSATHQMIVVEKTKRSAFNVDSVTAEIEGVGPVGSFSTFADYSTGSRTLTTNPYRANLPGRGSLAPPGQAQESLERLSERLLQGGMMGGMPKVPQVPQVPQVPGMDKIPGMDKVPGMDKIPGIDKIKGMAGGIMEGEKGPPHPGPYPAETADHPMGSLGFLDSRGGKGFLDSLGSNTIFGIILPFLAYRSTGTIFGMPFPPGNLASNGDETERKRDRPYVEAGKAGTSK